MKNTKIINKKQNITNSYTKKTSKNRPNSLKYTKTPKIKESQLVISKTAIRYTDWTKQISNWFVDRIKLENQQAQEISSSHVLGSTQKSIRSSTEIQIINRINNYISLYNDVVNQNYEVWNALPSNFFMSFTGNEIFYNRLHDLLFQRRL